VTPARSGPWARGLGLTLLPVEADAVLGEPGLVRALQDGIDRQSDVALPPAPAGATWYAVREGGETIAIVLVHRDYPRAGVATLLAVAVDPARRGRATATKAILVAERKLAAEGYAPLLVRVPRTNGRGLYFMLRVGFVPVPPGERPDDPGDVTWFARRVVA
jgi:GNAT superfamily N-acetyltransferase